VNVIFHYREGTNDSMSDGDSSGPTLHPDVSLLWARIFTETDILSMDGEITDIVECFKILLCRARTRREEDATLIDLLPAAAQFLTLLEGDIRRQRKYSFVIERDVIPFLENLWTRFADHKEALFWWINYNDGSAISWTCTCSELLLSISMEAGQQQQRMKSIKAQIVQSMKAATKMHNDDPSLSSLQKSKIETRLNQVVDTFLSLVEDITMPAAASPPQSQQLCPSPEESQVLTEAFKIIRKGNGL
jgi:hypothetical protein